MSNDLFFTETVHDIVALYLNPPDHSLVLPAFLLHIEANVPAYLDVCQICDNYASHKHARFKADLKRKIDTLVAHYNQHPRPLHAFMWTATATLASDDGPTNAPSDAFGPF